MTTQQTGIAIPMPCGQVWHDMQATKEGRHCSACNQTVTDFTAMTDDAILAHLRQNGPGGCGRFRTSQLNRPLAPATAIFSLQNHINMKHLLTVFIGSLLVGSTTAQLPVYDTSVYTLIRTRLTDSVILAQQQQFAATSFRLQGTVTDENNQPLPGAVISIGNAAQTIQTDDKGNFDWLLPHPLLQPFNTVTISASGKANQVLSVHWTALTAPLLVKMMPPPPCACPTIMGSIAPTPCCDLNIRMRIDKMFVSDKKTVPKKRR